MTAIAIQAGFPQFADTDGTPLNSGKIYIGEVDKDPVANPLPVFFDEALTIPAAQPLDTTNGYLFYQGTPAAFYVGGSYSIKVLNKNEVTVYENPKGIVTNVTNNVENVTQYLGAASSPPTTRTDGTALQVGDIYFDTSSNLMKVYDGSSFIGFAGPYLPLVGGTMGGNIEMQDNNEVRFGNTNDLRIYHDGSNSYIREGGTGNLIIQGDADITLGSANGPAQLIVQSTLNEGVDLFYGSTKRFETTSSGASFEGQLNGTTLQFTNIQAKDGTAAGSIADSTGVVTLSSASLVHADILGGTADSVVIGGTTPAAGTFTTFNCTGATVAGDLVVEENTTGEALINVHNTASSGDADAVVRLDSSASGESVVEFYHDGTKVAAVDSFTDGNPDLNITTFGAGSVVDVQPNNSLVARFSSTGLDVTGAVEFDSLSGTGSVSVTDILDEDNMGSNSATALATQQSIKAYVDSQVGSSDALPEVLANGNTTSGTDLVVSSGDTLNASAATVTAGTVSLADTNKILLGDSSSDRLEVYYENNKAYLKNAGAGALRLLSSNWSVRNQADSKNQISTADGGAVSLYYDGNVKLATTNTGAAVTGELTASGLITAQDLLLDDNNPTITLNDNDGTNQKVDLTQVGGSFVTTVRNNTGHGSIDFKSNNGTNNLLRLRIATSGDTNFYETDGSTVGARWDASSGRFGFGGQLTPQKEIDVTGDIRATGGVYFGSTNAGDYLDDYEEGTWTPVMRDAATGGNVAGASNLSGLYTKIGRHVILTVRVINVSKTGMTATNDIYITGLPFAAANLSPSYRHIGNVESTRIDFGNSIQSRITEDTNYMMLSSSTNVGGLGTLNWSALDADESGIGVADLFITHTYIAD